jgi:kinetochore protein Nuf2
VDDFNLRDIYFPERERTIILLSAFINFLKFTAEFCDGFLKDLHERSDALIVQRDDIGDKVREIQEKVDEIKCVHLLLPKQYLNLP